MTPFRVQDAWSGWSTTSRFDFITRIKIEYSCIRIKQTIPFMLGRFRVAKGIARTTRIVIRGASICTLPSSILQSRSCSFNQFRIVQRSQFICPFGTEAAECHSLQRGNMSSVSSFEDAISLIDVIIDC